MSDDKMLAEFEKWAKASNCCPGLYYTAWQVWQAAYAAGRMAVQREKEEWSKRVNKRWIEMQNKLEGER